MSDDASLLDPQNPSGPVTIGDLRVYVDRDLCIGAATCIAVAPHTYTLDSEAKAIFLDTAAKDDNQVQIDAARACPVAAIIIEDSKGSRVFP